VSTAFAHAVSLPDSVAEIVPDELYAIGGAVPQSISVSWIDERASGWTPVQCFVFISNGKALVMDCGLPAHTAEVGAGLDALLAGCPPPRLLVSRWEPDAMGALPWLVERYKVPEVLSYAGLNPLDFFEGFERAAARSQVDARRHGAQLVPILPGDIIEHGSMRLTAISPALRLLLTMWYYESSTRSLFTADAFTLLTNPSGPAPLIARDAAGKLTSAVTQRCLRAKFDWLVGAYCEEVIADLDSIAARYEIDRICPTIGAIIEGPALVQKVFRTTTSALRALAKKRRQSALIGFDWKRALTSDPLF
jgi:glyoxylase-like metal-dependent hydrolase (beta-lactamase superfamily II)